MKLKRVLACLLAVFAMASVVGCTTGGEENSSSNSVTSEESSETADIPEATVPQEDFQAHYVEGMLHDVNVDYNSPANLNFIKDSQSEYEIVLGSSIANLVSSLVLFVGVTVIMFVTNWLLALVTIATSIIGIIFMMLIIKKSQKHLTFCLECAILLKHRRE